MNFLEQNFECSACGRCCRGWKISVDPKSYQIVNDSEVEAAVRAETGGPGMKMTPAGDLVTARPDGDCVYLDSHSLCRIHGAMGGTSKPLGCQQFPFLITRTPDGVSVSASFYCPSVQKNQGPALASYREDLERLLELQTIPVVGERVAVREGIWIPWSDYQEIESWLGARLNEDFNPSIARLLAALAGDPLTWKEQMRSGGEAILTDPTLVYLRQMYLVGFLDRIEVAEGRLVGQSQAGGAIEFPSLKFSVTWADLEAYARDKPLEWMPDQLTRYVQALLHRRFLALPPGLMEALLALSLLPSVIETYTYLTAMARGAAEPTLEDFWGGVERCERDLVTHGREAFAMTGSYLKFLRDRVLQL